MVKLALLIGVSEYEAGLTALPGAAKDMRQCSAYNADAKTKCPAARAAIDKTWEGGWHTTVWGKESVCSCKP